VSFTSREAAGRELGRHLAGRGIQPDVVLGLPRGGVVVAAEVARILQRPLEALVVRKIGHPQHREFAVGALAERGIVVLDESAMREGHVSRAGLDQVIAEETARLRNYEARFHRAPEIGLGGKTVLLVDDGLATGATTEAAVLSARNQMAGRVIVAAPVASVHAYDRLNAVADEVVALVIDPDFVAVGQYYAHFPQTDDEEVLALLNSHARAA
jgi:putative phosphoribosyl transferase